MPTAVNTLVGSVTALLHDADNDRWGASDIAQWLNDGQLAVIRRVPAAYPKTAVIDLVEGTQQSIPSDGLAFIRFVRNVSAADKPQRAPRRVSHELQDIESPDWHAATADKVVKSYTYDPAVPKVFWVSPPQPATSGRGEIQYSAVPPTAVAGGDVAIDKIYDNAMIEYALYRAFARDAEEGDDVRAQKHLSHFEALTA